MESPSLATLRIDDVGKIEGLLLSTLGQPVDDFHSLHQRMILVRYFVFPRPESASTEYPVLLQSRKQSIQRFIAAESRCRIAALDTIMPDIRDFTLVFNQVLSLIHI